MNVEEKDRKGSAMLRLAAFIVDKRNLIFFMVVLALIFSVFSSGWVQVENDLTAYLPPESETRVGLDRMEEQFTTYGSAEVMAANVTLAEAEDLLERIEALEGVQRVEFDGSEAHYAHASALYSVTFSYDEDDDRCLAALDAVTSALEGQDVFISTSLGDTTSETITTEVNKIMVVVAIIVVAVLLLTSDTYAEVPVLLLTFVTAMIVNKGTNFVLGTISFVSNSVTSILQLALSLDYAVILSNRFKEEHKALPIRDAAVVALSKAIPEIGASCLTTVGGLVAMLFMQFRIGPDMAVNLIKAIAFALLSVFVLMPGLLVLFGPLIDRTAHRSFVPKIPFVGRFAYATRKVVPLLFVAVVIAAFFFSGRCPYAYGYGKLSTPVLNDTQIAENMIRDNFTATNMVALVVPGGDTDTEAAMLRDLEKFPQVESTQGLCNIEAMDGYMLTDRLTPRQFAELADIDYSLAQLVYSAYATDKGDYGKLVSGIAGYGVPLMDIFLFVCDQVDAGFVTLDPEQTDTLHSARDQMTMARKQLQGPDFDRMLVFLSIPAGDESLYPFLDTLRETAQSWYPGEEVLVVGNMTNEYDFQKSFSRDNLVVSIVTLLVVLAVLLFTFTSVGMPLLLILVIQGSIWINFSVPYFINAPLFFMSYLVVSSIQMGANIDYAIVIASRYNELKHELSMKEAIVETLNFAFPTIITSGTILAMSGILIGQMTSEACIVGIGQSLGRGTILSIFLVMFVLPQILLLGGGIVDRTSFAVPKVLRHGSGSGLIRINGMVSGHISGTVSGMMNALVDGKVDVNLISGGMARETEQPAKEIGPAKTDPAEAAEEGAEKQ